MAAMVTTSNLNAKVPDPTPGTTTPLTSPNLSAGYNLPIGTTFNAYGQTVLNPGIGSALAPLASTMPTPPPAAKATAPTPPATPPTTATPAASASSSASGSPAGSTTGGSSSTLLRDVKPTCESGHNIEDEEMSLKSFDVVLPPEEQATLLEL
jgi:hypothetical protein